MDLTALPDATFHAEWMPREQRVFSGRDPIDGAFRSEDWQCVLLPGGLLLDEDHSDALRRTARSAGDSVIVIAGAGDRGANGPKYLVEWNRALIEAIVTDTELGHVDAVAFGASETWGLWASPESFAVLGGTLEFMKRFIGAAGGEGAIQTRFRDLVEENGVGFGPAGEHYVTSLLKTVGWPARSDSRKD